LADRKRSRSSRSNLSVEHDRLRKSWEKTKNPLYVVQALVLTWFPSAFDLEDTPDPLRPPFSRVTGEPGLVRLEMPEWCARYLIDKAPDIFNLTLQLPVSSLSREQDQSVKNAPKIFEKSVTRVLEILGFAGRRSWNPFKEYARRRQTELDATALHSAKLFGFKASVAQEEIMKARKLKNAVEFGKQVAHGRKTRGPEWERILADVADRAIRKSIAADRAFTITGYPVGPGPHDRWEMTADATGEVIIGGPMPIDEVAVREAGAEYLRQLDRESSE
jgi:hypothetical protein